MGGLVSALRVQGEYAWLKDLLSKGDKAAAYIVWEGLR